MQVCGKNCSVMSRIHSSFFSHSFWICTAVVCITQILSFMPKIQRLQQKKILVYNLTNEKQHSIEIYCLHKSECHTFFFCLCRLNWNKYSDLSTKMYIVTLSMGTFTQSSFIHTNYRWDSLLSWLKCNLKPTVQKTAICLSHVLLRGQLYFKQNHYKCVLLKKLV
jgi:hypothetical protein